MTVWTVRLSEAHRLILIAALQAYPKTDDEEVLLLGMLEDLPKIDPAADSLNDFTA